MPYVKRVFCQNRVRLFGFLWKVRCSTYLPATARVCPSCGAAVPPLGLEPR